MINNILMAENTHLRVVMLAISFLVGFSFGWWITGHVF